MSEYADVPVPDFGRAARRTYVVLPPAVRRALFAAERALMGPAPGIGHEELVRQLAFEERITGHALAFLRGRAPYHARAFAERAAAMPLCPERLELQRVAAYLRVLDL